jgi:hypothetical protein
VNGQVNVSVPDEGVPWVPAEQTRKIAVLDLAIRSFGGEPTADEVIVTRAEAFDRFVSKEQS